MARKQYDGKKISVLIINLGIVIVLGFLLSNIRFTEINRVTISMMGLMHITSFYISDYYKHYNRRGYFEELKHTLIYSMYMLIGMVIITFMTKGAIPISRRGVVMFVVINAIIIYLFNIIIRYYQLFKDKNNPYSTQVYVITTSQRLDFIMNKEKQAGAWGGNIVAVTLMDGVTINRSQYPSLDIVPEDNLIDFAQRRVVDEIIINVPSDQNYKLAHMISVFESMGIIVNVSISAFDFDVSGEKRVKKIAGLSVVSFSTRFYDPLQMFFKRLMDIIGAMIGLLLFSIFYIIIGPIIKLTDGGPIIFAQERAGKNGRIFKCYKFRSMYVDAEERKKDLMKHNEMTGHMFKMENDPRITKIGKFIRKTSIDEFPQFLNVLLGQMSLVGTRPPTKDEFVNYSPMQKKRLRFKPGITGLWQASGRSNITNFDEIVALDVAYIDNWSLWLDIKIIIKTVINVAKGSGAK